MRKILTLLFICSFSFWAQAIELYRVDHASHSNKTLQLDISGEKGCGLVNKVAVKSIGYNYQKGAGHIYIFADNRGQLNTGSLSRCVRTKDSIYLDIGIIQSATPEDKKRMVIQPGLYYIWMNSDLKGRLMVKNKSGDFIFKPANGHHEPAVGMVLYRKSASARRNR